MSRRERIAERGRPYWSLTFASLLLVGVGSVAIAPLLRGSAWWWVMVTMAAIILITSALFRRLSWAPPLVTLGAIGSLVVALTLFFGNGTGILWLIPTPSTLGNWGSLFAAGQVSIQQQGTPAVASTGIVFILALGAAGIAILIDVVGITLRLPAVSGALILIPVAVPALVTAKGANLITLVVTAIAYLVLLRTDVQVRRGDEADEEVSPRGPVRISVDERRGPGAIWSTIGVGAFGIVAALVLTAATPSISTASLLPSGSSGVLFGSGVSPLVNLGQDLRRPAESAALHYSTTAKDAPYLKLLTLDSFSDSDDWVATSGAREGSSLTQLAEPQGLEDTIDRSTVRTNVKIDGVVASWLPVPYPATAVSGLSGDWGWNRSALTVSSRSSTTAGKSYTVASLAVNPTAAELRTGGSDYPRGIQALTALPDDIPEVIVDTARDVVAGSTNPYDQAVALQTFFRSSKFSYSTSAPVSGDYDGGSLGVLAKFLEKRSGYCIHFASAMAVMARTLGIPARLTLGYLPGSSTSDSFQGLPRYDVTSHDLHAWPELYFKGVGWVAFEPTVGRGSIPDYAQLSGTGATSTSTAAAVPQSGRPDKEITDPNGLNRGTTGADGQSTVGAFVLLVVAGIVVLMLLPFLIRRVIRWRRRLGAMRSVAPAALLWREFTATARDRGIDASPTDTERNLAERFVGAATPPPDVASRLENLLGAVERERYARPGATASVEARRELLGDLDAVLAASTTSMGSGARMRANFVPRSLWPEWLSLGQGGSPRAA